MTTIVITHHKAGFFSCCSVRLYDIIHYFNYFSKIIDLYYNFIIIFIKYYFIKCFIQMKIFFLINFINYSNSITH